MNLDVIEASIAHSLAGTANFPQIVGSLIQEGVESYHVDLIRMENRYYHSSGETLVSKVDLMQTPAAHEFNAAAVAAAVKSAQAGKLNYRSFVNEILNAGCVYYIAYLSGKKVSYFGRDGSAHIEHFPQSR